MPTELLDRFARETQLTVHIIMRDQARRWALELLILLFCMVISDVRTTAYFAVCLLVTEGVAVAFYPHVRLDGPVPPLGRSLMIWLNAIFSIAILLYPTYLFSSFGSTALMLLGLIWLFGLVVHVSNSYAAAPIYNWSMMAPIFMAGVFFIYQTSQQSFVASGTVGTAMACCVMLMFFLNTLETMKQHKDTLSALDYARNESKSRMIELENLTNHDPLTGLLNRRAFDFASAAMLAEARARTTGQIALFLVDLDGFKPINDSYSHAAGDTVLREIASRLWAAVPNTDVVARLGGDEFAIVTGGFADGDAAVAFAEKLAKLAQVPLQFEQRDLAVTASIGVALSTGQESVAQLLSQADQAMYRAKADPADRVYLFDADTFPVRATLDDRNILLQAMNSGELLPYYQPKVRLSDGSICGFEALARWEHPEEGLIFPGTFLPMIAELGLQGDFLHHTMTLVVRDIQNLLNQGLDPGQVSVNLPEITLATISGREMLLDLLRSHPMTIPYLTFEVTEDIFIARSGSLIQTSISQFRRMGVRISLDDFGTGFASFEHLRELEFDELKLDTGFVLGLGEDESAAVLVKAFLDIGAGLNVDIVAEGVERTVHRDLLQSLGCKVAQGYLFSKAVPFAQINGMLVMDSIIAPPFDSTSAA